MVHLLEHCDEIQNLCSAITESNNGIILYTMSPEKLLSYLSDFLPIELDESQTYDEIHKNTSN